ncbi:MAG TPA: type IV pilus secretin PilQ [Terriglobia bacterium]|nr:type IV pilus secretin PilQ [Terriglobia bacterium]
MKRNLIPMVLAASLFTVWVCFSADRHTASSGKALPLQTSAAAPATAANKPSSPAQTNQLGGQSPAEAENPATVEYVSVQADESGHTVVKIRTTRQVTFKPFHLTNPPRLVVDLDETQVTRFEKVMAKQTGAIKDIRVAQFRANPSPVARIVADLVAAAPFQIQSKPDGLQIQFENGKVAPQTLKPEAAAKNVAPTPHAPKGRSAPKRAAVQHPAYSTALTPIVDLTKPVKLDLAELKSAASARKISQPTTSGPPPQATARILAAADPPGPASPDPPQMQVAQTMSAAQTIAEVSPPGSAMQGAIVSTPFFSTQAPRYTGKLISLDLRDVDIRDFFRLIHRVSGLNLVVDPNVAGKITMVMDDVPWDQALDIVLKNNGLGKTVEDGVVRIAKEQTLTAEASAQAQTRTEKLKAEPLVTVIRRLKYAHAADQLPGQAGAMGGPGGMPQVIPGVATILNGFKGSVVSSDGKILADPRDNAVIITDHLSQIPIIEKVIDRLDTRAKQLSIQVRVILANSDFTRTLSSVLSGVFQSPNGHTVGAGGTGQGIVGVAPTSPPLPALTATPQPTTVGATGFGAFAITTASAGYAINAAITAAETRDQARTLSRPTIVTQDNIKGEVQQGVQIPIQTNINNTIAVQYVNATLQLDVTPQVTADNRVFLNIYVNNASVGTISTVAGPSINTQEATTQVVVPDGGTVVFGGITVTNRSRSATYVPLLGSIPIIGNLFKSSSINDQNQQLLFFVSPTILPG